MAWIELHQALFSHRKTVEAAEMLDIPEVYVVGHLAAIWSWALDNGPDGRIKARPRLVERVAQWPGESGKLIDALVEVGFLERDGEEFVIHDWWDYAGRLIEKRQKNTDRMRSARAKTCEDSSESVQRTCNAQPSHVQGLPNPTQPNPTQPTVPAREGSQPPLVDAFTEGTAHKPSLIDLKAILADRPHWLQWLEANRPEPKPGKTAEGYDRWQVCQWLNGEQEPPLVPPPPPVKPPLPEAFRGCLGESVSEDTTRIFVGLALQSFKSEGLWEAGKSIHDPVIVSRVIESARRDYRTSRGSGVAMRAGGIQ